MKNSTKSLFLLVMLLLVLLPGKVLYAADSAGRAVLMDQSNIDVQIPPAGRIDDLRKDKDLQYHQSNSDINFWDRFLNWLFKMLDVPRKGASYVFFKKYFWYILFGLALIFIIYQLFKSEITGLLRKNPRQRIEMEALEEDIHSIDFDKQIQDAIRQGNYRYAIRLQYLKALKILSDKGMIDWKPDKTGRDYQYELSGKAVQQHFISITNLFNWIWYGELPLDADKFELAREEFALFNRVAGQ